MKKVIGVTLVLVIMLALLSACSSQVTSPAPSATNTDGAATVTPEATPPATDSGEDTADTPDSSPSNGGEAETTPTLPLDPSVRGNSPGNIINGGEAATAGDWIFYANDNDGGKLYAIRTDGTDKRKLNDDDTRFINVVGDRIYYCNGDDCGKIYVMRMDGSERKKLNDDGSYYMSVVGDRIYYRNDDDGDKIYVMKTDGSEREKLNDDASDFINVVGDRIYYCNSNDDGKIYVMKTDGSDKKLLFNGPAACINVVGEKIYFFSLLPTSDYCICVMNTDGSDWQMLAAVDDFRFLNVAGDRIYYGGFTDDLLGIRTINTDGSGPMLYLDTADKLVFNVCIVDNWIYYNSFMDGFYRMNIDGSNHQLVE